MSVETIHAPGVPATARLGKLIGALLPTNMTTGWSTTAEIVTAPAVGLPAINHPLAKTMTMRALEALPSLPEAN